MCQRDRIGFALAHLRLPRQPFMLLRTLSGWKRARLREVNDGFWRPGRVAIAAIGVARDVAGQRFARWSPLFAANEK
jgi:hypothetical protein